MGNTSSSPVQKCLESAVGGNRGLLSLKGTPLFQISHIKPCNLGIVVIPGAVTYSETAEHITAIVNCAVDNKLKVQQHFGGRSYENYGIGEQDNTIVVNMKHFQQFSMDNSTRQATIGGGTLLGDVTNGSTSTGPRDAHGTCPQVGIGGHATIGELGPSSRMWGSALDDVEEGELGAIVTGTFFGSQQEYDSLDISARLPNNNDSVIELKDWLGVVGYWAEDVALNIVGGITSNFYAKSLVSTEYDIIPDDGVDKLFQYMHRVNKVEATWFIIWDLEGGSHRRCCTEHYCLRPHKCAVLPSSICCEPFWKVSDRAKRFWTGVNDAMTDALPEHDESAYAGYIYPALGENSASLYWSGNVKGLEGIKAQVDPDDVFHNPQSHKIGQRIHEAKSQLWMVHLPN